MAVVAHFLEHPLAVDFFLQAPKGSFHRLALFQFDLCQRKFTSSLRLGVPVDAPLPVSALKSGENRVVLANPGVNPQSETDQTLLL